MKRLRPPETLLGRTVLSLALAFLVFGVISTALLQVTLVRPYTRQAADDLAAFLVLAAQIWVELPPYTRPDYEKEMRKRHGLQIRQGDIELPNTQSGEHAYLRHLETALSAHIGQPVGAHRHAGEPGWLWVDIPMGGRMIRLGFTESRLQNRAMLILPLLVAVGTFLAFVLSALLVRYITRPLAAMAEATHRIGQGDFSAAIPENGPREIAELAHKLNRMEDRIGQLLENRTTLLAGISHDLRTPLARMRIELELLRNDDNGDLIEGLGADITDMEHLISDSLLLARGLGREDQAHIEIGEWLRDLAAGFAAAGNPVQYRGSGSGTTQVSINALTRVLRNLIENALTYSGEKAVILDWHAADENLFIRVTDHGPGIPEPERENIFQPFYRLETSRSRSTGGSGLGLAIVQQLCHANGWGITVSPASDGTGSVFELQLPGSADRS